MILAFSKEQKKAIIWSMVSVIMADGNIAPEEENLLIQIINNELNESLSILTEAGSLTQTYVIPILKTLSNEQKNIIVDYWEKLMMADGQIDPKEVQVIVAMGRSIDADVDKYRYLLGESISSRSTLQGTSWSNIDRSLEISFDSNSINGCLFNGIFGIYHYDQLNDLIQISIDDCGLSKNIIIIILSQSQNTMTVTINGRKYELTRKN